MLGNYLDDTARHSTIIHLLVSQEYEHAQAVTGGPCKYGVVAQVFHGWLTVEPGVGRRRRNEISWWGSDCWKNPVNMSEEFIEFKQTIIQAFMGMVKPYRRNRLQL